MRRVGRAPGPAQRPFGTLRMPKGRGSPHDAHREPPGTLHVARVEEMADLADVGRPGRARPGLAEAHPGARLAAVEMDVGERGRVREGPCDGMEDGLLPHALRDLVREPARPRRRAEVARAPAAVRLPRLARVVPSRDARVERARPLDARIGLRRVEPQRGTAEDVRRHGNVARRAPDEVQRALAHGDDGGCRGGEVRDRERPGARAAFLDLPRLGGEPDRLRLHRVARHGQIDRLAVIDHDVGPAQPGGACGKNKERLHAALLTFCPRRLRLAARRRERPPHSTLRAHCTPRDGKPSSAESGKARKTGGLTPASRGSRAGRWRGGGRT